MSKLGKKLIASMREELKTASAKAQEVVAAHGVKTHPRVKALKDKYNGGYTHEALHAAHMCGDLWDRHVLETRCAQEFPDVKEAAGRVSQAIHDMYQLIGQKFDESKP